MKFLGQQITSILLVVITALAISGSRVSNYLETTLYQEKEDTLVGYGQQMIENAYTRSELKVTADVLASENIYVQVHLPDGRPIYPKYDERNRSNLSESDLKRLKEGETLGFRTVATFIDSKEAVEQLAVYIPILYEQGPFPKGFLSLSTPLEDITEQVKQVQKNIIQSFVIASLLSITLGVIYAMWQARRIKRLQVVTKEIREGNFEVEITKTANDEIGELARDLKEMAQYLQESNDEVKYQEKLRREFMADVMHEMRTPLTTMTGLLEGLETGALPENYRQRSIELISQETKRLTRLVNENLDYERVSTKNANLNIEEIQAEPFLEEIANQLSVKASDKNTPIELSVEEGLFYYADSDRLRQIVINLLTNAIQFSQDAPITLSGWYDDEKSSSVIQVVDRGIGIDEKHIAAIWERFYKVDPSRQNKKYGESGIGLPLVKALVEAHDGKIEVESVVGEGSTFTVYLPYLADEIAKE